MPEFGIGNALTMRLSGIGMIAEGAFGRQEPSVWVGLKRVELKELFDGSHASWHPVGFKEMALVFDAGMSAFPARLREQPILYLVLNQECAEQFARDWKTRDSWAPHRRVDSRYIIRYPVDREPKFGPLRPIVTEVFEKFLHCGALERGFARIRCDHNLKPAAALEKLHPIVHGNLGRNRHHPRQSRFRPENGAI